MRIAFDLDGTLIDTRFESEPPRRWMLRRILKREQLRKGFVELFRTLTEEGHEIWVYTSSFRSKAYIRRIFRSYGIVPEGIINQQTHLNALRDRGLFNLPSKFPPAFRIDLLVDDQPGVALEGERFGFSVIVVDPFDERWSEKLLSRVRSKF